MAKTKGKSRKGKAATRSSAPKIAKPAKAAKPAKPARPVPAPSPAPPPPAPAAPVVRDEFPAPRDISRLLRYGERFGANKIDVRFLQHVQLPVTSGQIAVFDPGAPKSWRVLDRPAGAGQFRVMLSIAKSDDGKERLAAVTIHIGRPPIAKWTVAHYAGSKKPRSADALPRCSVTTGWLAVIDASGGTPGVVAVPEAKDTLDRSGSAGPRGAAEGQRGEAIEIPLTDGRRALALQSGNGELVAYWAVDASDKPICLVVDFEAFTQKDWKTTSGSRPAP